MTYATIWLRRDRRFGGMVRRLRVFIDDVEVGALGNGGERKFNVGSGTHTIHVRLDWWKSAFQTLVLKPDETVSLTCGVGLFGVYLKPGVDFVDTTAGGPEMERIAVHLEDAEERVPTSTETVNVPPGVKIKIRRSRTVEHTVEFDQTAAGNVRLEGGLDFARGSVQREISRREGSKATESVTTEYEVEVDGALSSQYSVRWADIWRRGAVEFVGDEEHRMLPFMYRARSELEVSPVSERG